MVLHAPVHQLHKMNALAPVQIRDFILKCTSEADSLRTDKSAIAMNETEAGYLRIIESIHSFCGCASIYADEK